MKRYLVTGGAGFIGSNFVEYMLKKYENILIVNLDKLTYAGNLENLKAIEGDKRHVFVKGDICDGELVTKLLKEYDIDVVVNFAAESHVDRSIMSSKEFIVSNILGTQTLLDASKNVWARADGYKVGVKFLQVSTDEVYGSLKAEGYFTENTPLDPHSPYSASKAAADILVKAYFDTHKLPVNITRCSNNYGAYQFPEKLIPLLINNAVNKKSIPVYGDGLNIRDWLYVEDHCKAIDAVIERGRLGEVYNVGGHNERTNIFIVKTVLDYLRRNKDAEIGESLITYVTDRKGHDRRYAIDPSKITAELGWYPETKFEDGIVYTIKWYLSNGEWLDNVLSESYKKYYDKQYKGR